MPKSIRRSVLHLSPRVLAQTAAILALSGLAACDGIGHGNSLESVHIVPAALATSVETASATYEETDAYTCVTSQLTLFGTFTNDELGTFTQRATWSSSNPEVAKISDGDLANPYAEGLTLAKGIVVPVSPGTTTVTAHYLDLSATIKVVVSEIAEVEISPVDPRLAVNSAQGFAVTAKLGSDKVDITSFVTAAFNPEAEEVAKLSTVSATPLVIALGEGGPLNLDLKLPVCDLTYSTTVRVAVPTALVLQHEEGFSGELVVNNTEKAKVMADFGDGPEQDLTSLSLFSRNNAEEDTTAEDRVGLAVSFIKALTAGDPVPVQAKCCNRDRNDDGDIADEGEAAAYTSNDLLITPVAGDLTSFTVDPLEPSVIESETVQFTAQGTFDNGARTQPITRLIDWSTEDTTVAAFFTDGEFLTGSGLLLGGSVDEVKTTTVTATPRETIDGDTVTAPLTTTVTVTPKEDSDTGG